MSEIEIGRLPNGNSNDAPHSWLHIRPTKQRNALEKNSVQHSATWKVKKQKPLEAVGKVEFPPDPVPMVMIMMMTMIAAIMVMTAAMMMATLMMMTVHTRRRRKLLNRPRDRPETRHREILEFLSIHVPHGRFNYFIPDPR